MGRAIRYVYLAGCKWRQVWPVNLDESTPLSRGPGVGRAKGCQDTRRPTHTLLPVVGAYVRFAKQIQKWPVRYRSCRHAYKQLANLLNMFFCDGHRDLAVYLDVDRIA
jgi:hypothetical protein